MLEVTCLCSSLWWSLGTFISSLESSPASLRCLQLPPFCVHSGQWQRPFQIDECQSWPAGQSRDWDSGKFNDPRRRSSRKVLLWESLPWTFSACRWMASCRCWNLGRWSQADGYKTGWSPGGSQRFLGRPFLKVLEDKLPAQSCGSGWQQAPDLRQLHCALGRNR